MSPDRALRGHDGNVQIVTFAHLHHSHFELLVDNQLSIGNYCSLHSMENWAKMQIAFDGNYHHSLNSYLAIV